MPRRLVTSEIFMNEKVGILPIHGRLLFIGIIINADDDGRLKASPRYLKALVFPYDNDITPEMIQEWRTKCHELKLIQVYNLNGSEYLRLPGWLEHQIIRKDRYRPSTIPQPSGNHLATNEIPSGNQETKTTNVPDGQPVDNQVTTTGMLKLINISKDNISKDNIYIPTVPTGQPSDNQTKGITKKAYGEFANVLLTDNEHQNLIGKFSDQGTKERIEQLSSGIASKGYKYKSHYAAILTWDRMDKKRQTNGTHQGRTPRQLTSTYTKPENL